MKGYAEFVRQLIPMARKESTVNPPNVYGRYNRLAGLIKEISSEVDANEALEKILTIYRDDRERRDALERKAEVVLVANGACLAVFLPALWITFDFDTSDGSHPLVVPATVFFLAIVYIVWSAIGAMAVQQRIMRHFIGLEEVVNEDGGVVDRVSYAHQVSLMVIENWKINSRWSERLEASRMRLRNGVFIGLLACIALAFQWLN